MFDPLSPHSPNDAVPSVELHDGPTPRLGVTDPCPYCGEPHVHGLTDDPRSHRVPHCTDREARKRGGLGYFVLRPVRSLLGIALRWWQPSAVPENLGIDDTKRGGFFDFEDGPLADAGEGESE